MKDEPDDTLSHLYSVINQRKGASPDSSYTAKLFAKGRKKICQKLGEEAIEVTIAAMAEGREQVCAESADLLYHLLVLWAEMDITPEDVAQVLRHREGISGIQEKRQRAEH